MSSLLSREKARRGQHILSNAQGWHADAFVVRQRNFEGRTECASCSKFPAETSENLCFQCDRDYQLGAQLPRAQYLAYYTPEQAAQLSTPQTSMMEMPLGWRARVLVKEDLQQLGQPTLVLKLNDPQISELVAHAAGFRYLANYVPLEYWDAGLSFEQIAIPTWRVERTAISKQSDNQEAQTGRDLLGYIKADVDYLGILFAEGLRRDGTSYDSATQLTALSREIDMFFSAGIQRILSQTPAFQRFYTVFSGGDDLLLVGPWDQAAQLALAKGSTSYKPAPHAPAEILAHMAMSLKLLPLRILLRHSISAMYRHLL